MINRTEEAGDRVQLYRQTLETTLSRLDRGTLTTHVPNPAGQRDVSYGFPFHPTPELFIQIDGVKQFETPGGAFENRPGEVTVMPAEIPHREIPRRIGDRFSDLIVMFRSNGFSFHVGYASPTARTVCGPLDVFPSEASRMMQRHANDLVSHTWSMSVKPTTVCRGLMMSLMGNALTVIDQVAPIEGIIPNRKVGLAQRSIDIDYTNPSFNLRYMADTLDCSADYLSRAFQEYTKTPFTQALNYARLRTAIEHLKSSGLTIAEIAWASGFSAPSYFNRVLRKAHGMTPTAYRSEYLKSK
ncbi:MAG: AraC family transcriptional regulator [Opitutales bacterium]|nr:AraC family transcriptional regulator [Opitutales bacterium]